MVKNREPSVDETECDPRKELRDIIRFPPNMDEDLQELNITLKLALIEVYY